MLSCAPSFNRNVWAWFMAALLALAPAGAAAQFSQSPLPYAFNALEPQIDALTMELHYNRHHKGAVDALNGQIERFPELAQMSLEEVLGQVSRFNAAVRNNAGSHYNHELFWRIMAPAGQGGEASEALRAAIVETFGSMDEFKAQFSQAAMGRFGSGWAWLVVTSDNKLAITSTPNQDNPLMDLPEITVRGTPILGLDVWEHSYYISYQNRRGDYVKHWWDLVNWTEVSRLYDEARAR